MPQTYSYKNNVLTISGSGTLEKFDDQYLDATKIIVNEGFTVIADSVFYKRTKLKELELPDSIETINNHLLAQTQIRQLRIPKNLVELTNKQPFDQDDYFERFIVDKDHAIFTEQDGILYSKDMKTLYSYPGGKKDVVYEIPYGVEILWYSCVGQNPYLKYIIVPSTAIESYYFFGYRSSAVKVIVFRCEDQSEFDWIDGDPFYMSNTMTKDKIDWLYTPYIFHLSSDASTLYVEKQTETCVPSNSIKGFDKALNNIEELTTIQLDTHIQALFDYDLFKGCNNIKKFSFSLKCFTKKQTSQPSFPATLFIIIQYKIKN